MLYFGTQSERPHYEKKLHDVKLEWPFHEKVSILWNIFDFHKV